MTWRNPEEDRGLTTNSQASDRNGVGGARTPDDFSVSLHPET